MLLSKRRFNDCYVFPLIFFFSVPVTGTLHIIHKYHNALFMGIKLSILPLAFRKYFAYLFFDI